MPSYLSKERYEILKKELEELKLVRRKEIAERIEEAIALGDLSENAEYHEAREEQAFNEGRVREIEELLKQATLIERSGGAKSQVSVGDTIEVSKSGRSETYTIVGSNEADPINGKISNESPIGKALLGRIPGEEVTVTTPQGATKYKVTKIL
jgi:transcription elongation factor GreA